jgi:hypothetical protein
MSNRQAAAEPVLDGPDMLGRWRLSFGRTHLTFDNREEAERAMREAPAPPARVRRAPAVPPLDSRHLTLRERGVVIRDPDGRVLGCIIGIADGRHALWLGRKKVGVYGAQSEAEAVAARAAAEGARKTNRKRRRP